jgi:hypothetical protein
VLNAYPDWKSHVVIAIIPADRNKATVVRVALRQKDRRIVPAWGARVVLSAPSTSASPPAGGRACPPRRAVEAVCRLRLRDDKVQRRSVTLGRRRP